MTLIDFIRDPAWQFVGAVLALLAIFYSMYVTRQQKVTKKLTYSVHSMPLLSVEGVLRENVKLLTASAKVIEGSELIIFTMYNSGTSPITTADYERPVSIELGSGAEIVSAQLISHPKTLQISYEVDGSKLTFNPVLMNVEDMVLLMLAVNRQPSPIIVDARIIGVKELHKYKKPTWLTAPAILIGSIVGGIIFVGIIDSIVAGSPAPLVIHLLLILGLELALWIAGIVIGRRYRDREKKSKNLGQEEIAHLNISPPMKFSSDAPQIKPPPITKDVDSQTD